MQKVRGRGITDYCKTLDEEEGSNKELTRGRGGTMMKCDVKGRNITITEEDAKKEDKLGRH